MQPNAVAVNIHLDIKDFHEFKLYMKKQGQVITWTRKYFLSRENWVASSSICILSVLDT